MIDDHNSEVEPNASGRCLCGAVVFRVFGPLRQVVACHCGQCRKWHGHYAAYSQAQHSDVVFVRDEELRWFRSSEKASRGFCGKCGSALFWRPAGSGNLGIAAGVLDQPTGLTLVGHIFCGDRGDYYLLEDDLQKFPGSSAGAFDNQIIPRRGNAP